jgi:hypothetical protein
VRGREVPDPGAGPHRAELADPAHHPARRTHDDVRNGTSSLFAALDVASGKVISAMHRRHRHQEFLKFLKTIDVNVPAELDVHLICDNYQTHKTPEIKRWFLRHPASICTSPRPTAPG